MALSSFPAFSRKCTPSGGRCFLVFLVSVLGVCVSVYYITLRPAFPLIGRFGDGQFVFYFTGEDIQFGADVMFGIFGNCTDGVCFAGDGIAQVTSVDFAEIQVLPVSHSGQESVQYPVMM